MDTSTVPNYNDVYNSLGSVYDPQTKLVQSQIDALQPQQDAQQASLDQAKVNAFKDIGNSANAKGMLFSGFTPDQQATYVGTKYLPAVANLKTSFNNTKNTLLGQINSINQNRSSQASTTVAKAQQQASTDAYHNAQLQLSYARLNRSGSSGLTASQQLAQQQQAQMKSDIGKLASALQGKDKNGMPFMGRDGYVSPDTYKAALKEWNAAGYKASDFHNYFAGFRNPGNPYYGVK